MIRHSRLGGLAAGLALLLAGCGPAGLQTDGPFGRSPTTSSGSQCFWAPRDGVGTMGLLSFGNSGGKARIDKVILVGARHLRIAAAWAVPITGHTLLGVFQGYPPTGIHGEAGPLAPGVQWRHR